MLQFQCRGATAIFTTARAAEMTLVREESFYSAMFFLARTRHSRQVFREELFDELHGPLEPGWIYSDSRPELKLTRPSLSSKLGILPPRVRLTNACNLFFHLEHIIICIIQIPRNLQLMFIFSKLLILIYINYVIQVTYICIHKLIKDI